MSACIITYDDVPSYSVSIMEFENESVVHETQYFGDAFGRRNGGLHSRSQCPVGISPEPDWDGKAPRTERPRPRPPALCPAALRTSTRYRYLVPKAAIQVDVVAGGLAGSRVSDVGVERVAVIGDLACSTRPLGRSELAGHSGPGDRSARQRRPIGRTGAITG